MAGGLANSALIRFVFTSDVTAFNMEKVNKELSLAKMNTMALTAAFKILQAGMAMTIASAIAIVMPLSIAIKSVGELDRTLRLAASAADDTRVYTEMMGVVSDLAVTYGVAKAEIAGAVFEMSKAGIAFEDMAALLEPTVQLATGNMMDLQDAMSVGIVMFNLFSDSGYDAAKMLSMIDKAATISILDVQDLSQIIEQTGSAFAMSQVPMEQYLALMASLSQEGITMGARHGSIISQMLGREGEIEAIVGDSALIEKGVLNMNMLMEYLRDIEEGSSEYQSVLQVFGAGKGGKTFLDMMRAASGTYFDFTQEILGASDEMENKAKNMAESLPAMMTRIKEAMTAPFANPEMIERINIALNTLLDTIGSDDYNNALVSLVENSASFLTTSGPQIINMFTRLLMLLQDSFPTFNTFLNLGIAIMTIMSHIPAEILAIIGGVVMFNKALGPLIVTLSAVAGSSAAASMAVLKLQFAMMGIAAGFMLAISSSEEWVRYMGVVIATVGTLATAIWALNTAKAFGMSLNPLTAGFVVAAATSAAFVASMASAMSYKPPTDYLSGSYQDGQQLSMKDLGAVPMPVAPAAQQQTTSGQMVKSSDQAMSVGVYVANQNNYIKEGDGLEVDLKQAGVV